MADGKLVLAVVDCDAGGALTNAGLEALGAAAALRDGLGWQLAAALVAPSGSSVPVALGERGAARVVHLDGPCVTDGAALADAVWPAVIATEPAATVFSASAAGREAAARLAARTGWDTVAGCNVLKPANGEVRIGRACLGGKAQLELCWDTVAPLVLAVDAGAFAPPPARTGRQAEVISQAAGTTPDWAAVTHIGETVPPPEALDVTEADVLVAGGAGVGGPEGFGLLTELARRLGGTLAASRVAVDRGWAPHQRQVGQTGKSVSPKVYLAFGISGAPQHIAGIRNAGKVVAINQDPRAPIFGVADLAVVADLHELVPALIDRLAAARQGAVAEKAVSA